MKKGASYVVVVLFILMGFTAQAQQWTRKSSLEFGFMVGGSNYSGDLTDKYFET